MSEARALELQELAWTLQADGRLDEAATACREAIEEMGGEDAQSPDIANLLNDAAEIEVERQQFEVGLALAMRAAAIEERLGPAFSGDDAAQVRIRTCGLLGEGFRRQGAFDDAERALRCGLDVATAEFGADSEAAAGAANDLAVLYKYAGRFDDALQHYARTLPILERAYGQESAEAAIVWHNIGGALHAAGRFAEAEPPARRAWQLSAKRYGEHDWRSAIDAAALAAVLDGLGRYQEARSLHEKALASVRSHFGEDHVEVASVLHNLAASLDSLGLVASAADHYRRALDIRDRILGAESLDTALTCNNFGALLARCHHHDEARALLERANRVFARALAPAHPQRLAVEANLRRVGLVADPRGHEP